MFDEDLNEAWYVKERDEEDQLRSVRLNALCRVYEQADRVLTGDPVIVNVVPDGPAPAWSDGAAIYINADQVNEIDLETLTQVNGLNYHELAHHLYTPRRGTDLMKWVMDNSYLEATNMLEDQRIETLLVARYPSIAPYLTATVARWLGSTPDEAAGNYILVRGRRYLPLEIRQAFRDMFAAPELIPAAADIIDQYRVLAFPRDYAKAKELIKRFNDEVLGNLDMPKLPQGPNGCSSRDPVSKGRPEPGKAQERDAKRAEGMGKAESTQVSRKPNPQPNTNKPLNEQLDHVLGIPQTAADALDMREQAQQHDAPPSPTPGTGHHDSKGGIPNNVHEMLDNAIADVLDRKDVQQDVKTKQKVIVGGDGRHDDAVKAGKFDKTTVPAEAMSNFRRFARELQRLRDECEPMWHREEASGRLNVQRAIRGCEIDQAFDRWDEGSDGADVEAVIMIDRSGSMSSGQNDRNASIACWTIKRALEEIGAPVTVYAFDDKAEVAYRRDELAHRTLYKFIYGNGGTNPYSTLMAAEQLLMSSRRKNKMLFIVTDGQFDAVKNDEIIERIAKRGVLTAMTLIMSDRDMKYYEENHSMTMAEFRHGTEIFGRISTARDLVPFAKSVVMGAIRKRGR
jgi:Mg-chelatase subunit ChlD